MSKYKLKLPKLGESILNATVVRWLKQAGEAVVLDEPICEVATDKVNSEIPSPVSGIIHSIEAQVDQTVDVGEILALIETDAEIVSEKQEKKIEQKNVCSNFDKKSSFLSPSVLRLAKENSISIDQIGKVMGTGLNGRVTKEDVLAFLESKQKVSESGQRIVLTPLRKAIAKSVTASFYTAPHAFLVQTIDLSDLVQHIEERKASFLEKNGCKLTLTAPICKCLASTLEEFPVLNGRFDQDSLLLHKNVNLGVAVSVENGVLVPIIQNCNEKSIICIARDIQKLASKVRDNHSTKEDLEGGTFTLTNFGMSGIEMGLPIIREGEIAILGLGALIDTPSVIDGVIKVRKKMRVTLSFDHRAIDGMLGCSFLNHFQKLIESFRL